MYATFLSAQLIFLSGTALALSIPSTPPGMPGGMGYVNTAPSRPVYRWMAQRKDGARLEFRSSLYEDAEGSYLRLDDSSWFSHADSNLIRPRDLAGLKAVMMGAPDWKERQVAAETLGGTWLFPLASGRLSLYSKAPGSVQRDFILVRGGELEFYSTGRLREYLRADPAADAQWRQGTWLRAGSAGMVIGGLGLALAGVFLSNQEVKDEFGRREARFEMHPLIPIGLGTTILSWVPYLIGTGRQQSAIATFNRDMP